MSSWFSQSGTETSDRFSKRDIWSRPLCVMCTRMQRRNIEPVQKSGHVAFAFSWFMQCSAIFVVGCWIFQLCISHHRQIASWRYIRRACCICFWDEDLLECIWICSILTAFFYMDTDILVCDFGGVLLLSCFALFVCSGSILYSKPNYVVPVSEAGFPSWTQHPRSPPFHICRTIKQCTDYHKIMRCII